MMDTKYLQADQIDLQSDATGQTALYYHSHGQLLKIRAKRLFPLTQPDAFIAFLDESGREVGIVKHISQMPRDIRDFICRSLEEYYFIPCIQEIESITEEFGISNWTVVTDRGRRSFDVRNRSTDIILFKNRRILIKDADDNTYEIPDHGRLPAKSQQILDGEI